MSAIRYRNAFSKKDWMMRLLAPLVLVAATAAAPLIACKPPASAALTAEQAPPSIDINGYRIVHESDGERVVLPVTNLECSDGYAVKLVKPASGPAGLAQLELVAKSTSCAPIHQDRPVALALDEVRAVAGAGGFVFINKLAAN
jgi:hypothetical protein